MGLFWPTIKRVMECRPTRVLDLGCGTGRFGVCVRDYLEDVVFETNPALRSEWKVFLEGVELFPAYTSGWGLAAFDQIHIGVDIRSFASSARAGSESWDVVLCLDVIEHLPVDDAKKLVSDMLACSDQYVIVGGPYGSHPQEPEYGNEAERHLFDLDEKFFEPWRDRLDQMWRAGNAMVAVLKGKNPRGAPPPSEFVYENMMS